MARPLVVNEQLVIPAAELTLSFARSAGPGGQNVNKVNSKAVLRWNITTSSSLAEDVKSRFFQRFPQRINRLGEVVLASDRHRDQPQNISACYEKLRLLIFSLCLLRSGLVRKRDLRVVLSNAGSNPSGRQPSENSGDDIAPVRTIE